jgi:D-alanyl-D-alanine carboxypeptidase (penicillin-binding protein 5/6)
VRLLSLLLIWSLSVGTADARATAARSPSVSAPEAIVIDGTTGQVLYARNPDGERYPASTVKIMTALVVLQHRIPMNRIVTVSSTAATYGGSSAGLYSGEQISVWNLLHGMLLPSGNDAAVALAQATAGSLGAFVSMMDATAVKLHLWHTHYLSPNGFDTGGQFTTARDLASLTRIAMQQPRFARIVRTKTWTVRNQYGQVVHRWTNLNHLLWTSPAVDGVKTGTTPGAGACLVSSARAGGRWVIAVNMGSTEATRFSDGLALLKYALPLAAPLPTAR